MIRFRGSELTNAPLRPGFLPLVLALLWLLQGCGRPASQTALVPSGGALPPKTAPRTPDAPGDGGVRFADRAEEAGIHYRWTISARRPLNILQTIGNGCAFLDYNNDGFLDILLVGPKLALYKGDGKGHFTDVTHETGLDKLHGHFLGCAVGDYDNDGFEDIYLSGYHTGLLLHNEQGKAFTDVTQAAGLQSQPWGTSAAWAETIPGSGRLDLFIANYARFGPQPGIPQLCDFNGIKSACGPRYYTPIPGVLYRNLGRGRFAGETMTGTSGRGLGVAFADLDNSGRPSLAIANDEMAGDLMTPSGPRRRPRFVNTGASSGIAFDRDGNKHGGMGADWGDYDNDGRLDLIVTTFQNEPKSLYHNEGGGQFSDLSYQAGLGASAAPNVSFGCKFADFDNDGWLDLIIAGGHVQDNIEQIDTSAHYRQPTRLFRNEGSRNPAFTEVSQSAGPAFQIPIVGRGLAVGDYDNDGRVDVLVVDSEGKPLLLHNETRPAGHWLGIRLIGVGCNRDGYGALLTARFAGRTLLRHTHADGSYLSSSDSRVHFGLGVAAHVDTLTIRWPDGRKEVLSSLPADRYLTVREGKGIVP